MDKDQLGVLRRANCAKVCYHFMARKYSLLHESSDMRFPAGFLFGGVRTLYGICMIVQCGSKDSNQVNSGQSGHWRKTRAKGSLD